MLTKGQKGAVYGAHAALFALALWVDPGFALPGLIGSAVFFTLWQRK